MSRRNSTKSRYGDHCFREAAIGKSPDQIRRELAELSRAGIRRSIAAGVAVVRSNWPWLQGLQRRTG